MSNYGLTKNGEIIDFAKELTEAWKEGSKSIRAFIVSGLVLSFIAITIAIIGEAIPDIQTITKPIAISVAIPAAILLYGVYIHRKSLEQVAQETRIEEVQQRVKNNPHETQAAWELARVKLESYLNRNLNQVRSIFWLTVFVMLVGFALIAFGVYTIIESPNKIDAAIISSIAGVIVNFIGASFLVLYKSTMSQATEYVAILERINAVGMSVQILDTLEDDDEKLKQKTTAELSKLLLALYQKT